MHTLNIYIGWDARDINAYNVCYTSLKEHASIHLNIMPLKEWELRRKGIYWRTYRVEAGGLRVDSLDHKYFNTDFSFTRFLVPELENFGEDIAVFMDPDFMWRVDIAELIALCDEKALYCVQHNHEPTEHIKGVGIQENYFRKNWSSLMVFRPSLNKELNAKAVNSETGQWLHAMSWLSDEDIGDLPTEWNWLEGWSSSSVVPKVVHYTRGTPDMKGYEDSAYAEEWRSYL